MMNDIWLTNGQVVLPDRVLSGAGVLIRDGVIDFVGHLPAERDTVGVKVLDACGGYILPGLVDLHCDAIEKELEPRPGVFISEDIAFAQLEKKLAGQGITTMYHSLSFTGAEHGIRCDERAAGIIRRLVSLAKEQSLINHKIHLRFEITNGDGVGIARNLIEEGVVDLLSFMDHTPGQGQYPTVEDYKLYMQKTYHRPVSQIDQILAKKEEGRSLVPRTLAVLGHAAQVAGVPLASHDEDSAELVGCFRSLGSTISEFPVNMAAARAAQLLGSAVCVGAPNIVRGGSSGKALSAREAVVAGLVNLICSDYYPPAMLQAVFILAEESMTLPKAVQLATLEPARAAGLDRYRGSLEKGKSGDVIVVSMRGQVPVVTQMVTGGVHVYAIEYRPGSVPDRREFEDCAV